MTASRKQPDRQSAIPARLGLALLLAVVLLLPTKSPAFSDYQPDQIKAALLFKFAKLIGWPPDVQREGPFTFCILGEPRFAQMLSGLVSGKTISGRSVAVKAYTAQSEVERCEVLFVGQREQKALPELVQRFQYGVLFVGDGEELLSKGGVVGFLLKNDRIRFSLSRKNAGQYHLVLSRELQSLAETILE